MEDYFYKRLRRLPFVNLLLILMFLGFKLFVSYHDMTRGVRLQATAGKNYSEKSYFRADIKGNNFVAGLTGDVFWKPESFKESIVLNMIVKDDFMLSAFDIVYLLMLNLALYVIIRRMRQNDFFSIGVIKMVDSVPALLVIYGLVPLLKYKVADYYLENISNGELSAVPYQNHSFILFCIGALFFKLFPILIRKARDVEKDQTLTI